jgi:hypothetical protein
MGFDDMENLRRSALEEETVTPTINPYLAPEPRSEKMFGMTAVERMFVSIGCFMVTSLGGFLLLLIMDKIAV